MVNGLTRCVVFMGKIRQCTLTRASDRVRKKITNYAEVARNIMQKKALIMQKTCWIMWKISSFHAAKIALPPEAESLLTG